jgi:hypothetical protein
MQREAFDAELLATHSQPYRLPVEACVVCAESRSSPC